MTVSDLPDSSDVIRIDGPWTHRDITAHACRFHIVEAGEGPLVVLLHGFPLFWWTWRNQLVTLAAAGYRVVAMDVRGYGGSDHTPHGYDPLTLAADVAGVIRALGEPHAVVVGQGWGAITAWTLAALEPELLRGIAVVGMPHPALLRHALLNDSEQRRLGSYLWGLQVPFLPERRLVHDHAAQVETYLRAWGAPGWPDPPTARTYRAAMLIPNTAHCSVEYHRWAVRSIPRRDGRRFQSVVAEPLTVPVLQIHGLLDGAILPRVVDGGERYAGAGYTRADLPSVGHFPQEESPVAFDEVLIPWLKSVQVEETG